MPSNTFQAREARMRRAAAREGLQVVKSRRRTLDQVYVDDLGGYMVVDPARNMIEAGEGYSLGLDDLETMFADS